MNGLNRFVKRLSVFTCALALTACAGNLRGLDAPELMLPVGMRNDTAHVTRGDIVVVSQMTGLVRTSSEGLFFTQMTLPFAGFDVLVGQEVRQGDVLARLDASNIERQIQLRMETIARM
jgi:hypothetical protein